MNEKRADLFTDWFGQTVQINDCDPALYIINYFFDRFEFNTEQKLWYSWIFGTTYQFPTTYVIWNEFPDFELVGVERLKEWNDFHYRQLRYQVDTKWNKGHLPEMFASYKNWVGNQSQQSKIDSLLTGDEFVDFEVMWKESKSWHKFGRYMAWFYLQTIKHCCGVKITPKDLRLEDYTGSRSHRNGLCFALGWDKLVDNRLNQEQLRDFNNGSEYLMAETKKKYPNLKGKLDYFAMETALCSFKKLFRVKEGRYLGYYLDRQAEEIKKVEQDGWIGINWNPLWEARKECIKSQYLTGKIDKEKMKLFLAANPMEQIKHLTMIGGLPITGKTTLMRSIRKALGKYDENTFGLFHYEEYPNHIIAGIYNGDTFDGTDKLSMAVIGDAIKFLKSNNKTVLLEGDRLFNQSFIQKTIDIGYNTKLVICQVNSLDELFARYKKRGQMQNMSFIKGRQTKISNIRDNFPVENLDTTSPVGPDVIEQLIKI